MSAPTAEAQEIDFLKVTAAGDFPTWAIRERVVDFFHETMKPYEDEPEDIERALDFAFKPGYGFGGFLMLARYKGSLCGALLMLKTGMSGYIPENILLFVTVDPELRGMGIGRKVIERSIDECDGDVKLHVEYDNPAKRLYERIGFTTNYAEMRFKK